MSYKVIKIGDKLTLDAYPTDFTQIGESSLQTTLQYPVSLILFPFDWSFTVDTNTVIKVLCEVITFASKLHAMQCTSGLDFGWKQVFDFFRYNNAYKLQIGNSKVVQLLLLQTHFQTMTSGRK